MGEILLKAATFMIFQSSDIDIKKIQFSLCVGFVFLEYNQVSEITKFKELLF